MKSHITAIMVRDWRTLWHALASDHRTVALCHAWPGRKVMIRCLLSASYARKECPHLESMGAFDFVLRKLETTMNADGRTAKRTIDAVLASRAGL